MRQSERQVVDQYDALVSVEGFTDAATIHVDHKVVTALDPDDARKLAKALEWAADQVYE